jgi:hypothetical protein
MLTSMRVKGSAGFTIWLLVPMRRTSARITSEPSGCVTVKRGRGSS